jgi:DNA-binding transcriptional MocR family regulator
MHPRPTSRKVRALELNFPHAMDFLQSLLAPRLQNVETSAIRELFKVLGKPGLISFAGGFPDAALFDVEGLKAAADTALTTDAARALHMAPPRASSRCAKPSSRSCRRAA